MCVSNNMNHNTNNKSTTISPVVSSGFARQRVPIVASILGLVVFYNALCWLLKDSVSAKGTFIHEFKTHID